MANKSIAGKLAVAGLAFGLSALGSLTNLAYAIQKIEARDGVAVEAVASTREPTRIRIEGARIIDVVGNIYSSTCTPKAQDGAQLGAAPAAAPAVNPLGEFVLGCDLAKGEIYVRPVAKGGKGKPINLFLSTDQATYTLLLRPSDVPADTVVISDKTVRIKSPGSNGAASAGKSAAHVRNLKAMLVVMAGGKGADDISMQAVKVPKQLWGEARFEMVKLYQGRGLVGEQYQLTNISAAPMVLAEQEFDREGDGVLAVSIDSMNLRPGETTTVYVIRSGE